MNVFQEDNNKQENRSVEKTIARIDSLIDKLQNDIDEEYKKYSELYFKRFGRKAYCAMPGGSKEQTISAIKKCLEVDKDILDELLYPESNDNIIY